MFEPTIDFASVPIIPPSNVILFHSSSKHEIVTTDFDVNNFPEKTYAYSTYDNQWFVSGKEGHYIIALFWKEIPSNEVPQKYLEKVTEYLNNSMRRQLRW